MTRDDFQQRPAQGPRRDLGQVVTDSIGTLVDYLHIRGILIRLEAREAAAELGQKIAFLAIAGLFLAIGYVGLVLAVVVWAVEKLDWSWPVGIAIAAGLHITGGIIAFLISRRHPTEALFRDTLDQLEKDRKWLSKKENSKS